VEIKEKEEESMKKLKKIILRTLLYTICWRNVDKLYSLRHYDSYYVKL